jgi:hypothetical protein
MSLIPGATLFEAASFASKNELCVSLSVATIMTKKSVRCKSASSNAKTHSSTKRLVHTACVIDSPVPKNSNEAMIQAPDEDSGPSSEELGNE